MRRFLGLRLQVAYPGTLGITTDKGEQNPYPLVLDAPTESPNIMQIRFDTGVFPTDPGPQPQVKPVYYVSANGDDSASGRTPAEAWATVQRVNAATFAPGDYVAFRRGDVFYQDNLVVSGGTNDNYLNVCSYGKRNAPLPVLSSWQILDMSAWVESSPGVWRIDLINNVSGNVFTTGISRANTGRILVGEGDLKTIKKRTLGELAQDWDFYSDLVQYLYVKLSTNPKNVTDKMKAAPLVKPMAGMQQFVRFRDIHLTGSGGHAFAYTSNIDIQWCWTSFIGGSYQGNVNNGPRFGNGAENFGGGSNIAVTNNFFSDIYDVALTLQGTNMGNNLGWRNVDYSDNWAARCSQVTEFWSFFGASAGMGVAAGPNSGLQDVKALNLKAWDIGRASASPGGRDNPHSGIFLQFAIEAPFYPLEVSMAEMHNTFRTLIDVPGGGGSFPRPKTDYVIEHSELSLPAATPIRQGQPYTAETWAEFVVFNNIGYGSGMTIEPTKVTGENAVTPISKIYKKWQKTRPPNLEVL